MERSSTRSTIVLAAAALAWAGGAELAAAQQLTGEVDLGAFFVGRADVEATFVLLAREGGELTRYNPERSEERFRPASTFKIANTVVALETGVLSGPNHVLRFDPSVVPDDGFFARSWRRDHTLESAFRNSVYWYYQEVARRVGPDRMQRWVDTLDYGNRDIGDEIDSFWLRGGLRISPVEQVRFLSDLMEGRRDVSPSTVQTIADITVLVEGDGWRLHGKTGTSDVTTSRENGWIVGWVDAGDRRWYYALNMEGELVWEDWPPQARADLVLRILDHLEIPVEAS